MTTSALPAAPAGDADIAAVGRLLADPARCRILLAVNDGRALPASMLADEAGISPATASSHLGKLTAAGMLTVEQHGRHRYYRLAGPHVADALEVLQRLAPPLEIRSLRQGTRAHALRTARSCYDHVAGRLGVAVMAAFLDREFIVGGDGRFDPTAAGADHLSAPGRDVDYQLTDAGREFLRDFGIALPPRPVLRYCIDWSEQRHHLAGAVGRGILQRLLALDWVRRTEATRVLIVTGAGAEGLAHTFTIA